MFCDGDFAKFDADFAKLSFSLKGAKKNIKKANNKNKQTMSTLREKTVTADGFKSKNYEV